MIEGSKATKFFRWNLIKATCTNIFKKKLSGIWTRKKKTLTLNLFSKKKDKFVSSYGTLRFIKHIFYSSPDSEAGIRKRLHRGFDCVVLVIPKNIKRKYIILCILHGKERKRVLVFSSSYRDSNLILEALPS